jgi:putative lipoprotein (rSAM/lipoprotein system)
MKNPSLMFRLLKLIGACLGALAGIFCEWPGRTVVMYGMPQADFKIAGSVRSTATSQPVAGIRVSLSDTLDASTPYPEVLTDATGRYSITFSDYRGSFTVRLQATDVDGSQNGSYQDRDTLLTISDSDPKGAGGIIEKTVDLGLDPAGK